MSELHRPVPIEWFQVAQLAAIVRVGLHKLDEWRIGDITEMWKEGDFDEWYYAQWLCWTDAQKEEVIRRWAIRRLAS